MSVFHNNALIGSGGGAAAAADTEFSIQKSVRFNDDDSAHFSKTPSSAGNRRTFTWSGWFKRSTIDGTHTLFAAGSDANNRFALRFSSGQLFIVDQIGGGAIIRNRTEQQFRDVSSWYHFVVAIDSTQSTSTDRLKLYVNGGLVEDYDITNYPSLNQQFNVNSTVEHLIGKRVSESQYFDGYMANIHFIDGLGLAASDFGFYDDNNVWRPKEYSGTFGTNGFHLFDFANESTIGHDSSGNNNDYTANNFSTSAGAGNDVLFDSPTNGDQSNTGAGGELSSNYATLNALQTGSSLTLSNGNLALDGASGWKSSYSTIFLPSGKWYFEVTIRDITNHSYGILVGLAGLGTNIINSEISSGDSYAVQNGPGNMKINYNGGSTDLGSQSAYAVGDVLQMAYDADNGKLWFGKNGTYINSGNPVAGSNPVQSSISGTYCFAVALLTTSDKIDCNFGQRAWAYSAPTNFKAVCTSNLPTPTIADGSNYFDTKLYTGNAGTQSISLNFGPDLLWLKSRSASKLHALCDSVRGDGKLLYSSSTLAEQDIGASVVDLTSSGFNLGYNSGFTAVSHNHNNDSLVAWAWDAGSSTVSNTDGSITSSVRASATSGFSIASWTGTGANGSIGHGLNSKPQVVISKNRTDSSTPWVVDIIGVLSSGTDYMLLNSSQAANTGGSTADNSVVNILSFNDRNGSSDAMIAYCFTSVESFLSIGTYSGNGNADGTFVYTGFRPALILGKRSDAANGWFIFDSARDSYNVADAYLAANASAAEATFTFADFLSNGFKLRATTGDWNGSGGTVFYMAWAENPFQANGGLAR